ncbi:MAG: hypothetical protein ACRDZ5_03400 [Acidimicrobiales bacterium]
MTAGTVPRGRTEAPVAADRRPNTSITAEIPAVPAGPSYGVLLPDGTIWYPGSKRRLPAPLALRLAVWIVVFLTILAGIGVIIVRLHPGWLNPLRRVEPVSARAFTPVGGSSNPGRVASNTSSGGSATGGSAARSPTVTLARPQPSGLPNGVSLYDVSAADFSVQVTASHATWVADYSLTSSGAGTYPLEQTTLSAGETQSFSARGSVAVQVAAGLATVRVYSGGKQIGVADHPTPWIFWFEQAKAH